MTLKGMGIREFSELTTGRPISLLKNPRNSSVFRFMIFPTSYRKGFGFVLLRFFCFFLGGNLNNSTMSP